MSEHTISRTNDAMLTTDRVAAYAHDAIDLVATRVCGAEERARDAAATSLAKLEATQAHAKQSVGTTVDRLETFFDTKPVRTLGYAFVFGAVAAMLLRRG